jgi:hypothetical protein
MSAASFGHGKLWSFSVNRVPWLKVNSTAQRHRVAQSRQESVGDREDREHVGLVDVPELVRSTTDSGRTSRGITTASKPHWTASPQAAL